MVTKSQAGIAEVKAAYWSQATYTAQLRSAIYGLWRGALEVSGFVDSFTNAVFTGLSSAWFNGARAAGIEKDEMTDAETQALQVALFQQMVHIGPLANFIQANNQASGKNLAVPMVRLNLWASRYTEFYTRGYMMAAKDKKMIWNLGSVKTEHCGSCAKLSGKIKRASQWAKANIYPKNPQLACGGYNCACTLTPTDLPLSKGPLPKLP